ncbi:MAG: TonB-dependent receptor [Chitinophagales bacterium]
MCTVAASAQHTVMLQGQVTDVKSLPVKDAMIYLPNQPNGVMSNAGNFSLQLLPGNYAITFTSAEMIPLTVAVHLAQDTVITVILQKERTLNEAVVSTKKMERQSRHDADGVMSLTPGNFNSIPAFMGEHDPMRAVQMQPGVQSGSEGGRGIFIRGGSPDQNLMLLDGAPVYNPSHIYGFISVFNGDAVERVSIYKDRLPARYGGRLCSVIDVDMDEGNTNRLRGALALGVVASRFHLDGPLSRNKKTTFSLSLRGCYMGLFTGPISRKQFAASGYNGNVLYYFGDVNVKLVHRFSEKSKLSFSFFTNNDWYQFSRKGEAHVKNVLQSSNTVNELNWANYASTLAWNHRIGENWKLLHRLTFGRYQLHSKNIYNTAAKLTDIPGVEYNFNSQSNRYSHITNINFQNEATYFTQKQQFTFGVEVGEQLYQTGTGKSSSDETGSGRTEYDLNNPLIKATEVAAYVDETYTPVQNLTMHLGFHARMYYQQKAFASLLPRFSLTWNPYKRLFLRGSVSGTFQPLHLLTAATADIFSDLWVPATKATAPETGWNFSGGLLHKLPLGFEWSVDGFYRLMENVIDYKEGVSPGAADGNWQQQVMTNGIGRSYGAEFYVGRTFGRINGAVAYTLSWSDRKFSEVNDGKFYPYKYDRRHNLAAQLTFQATKNIELGLSYVYGSGYHYTLPVQYFYTYSGNTNFDYLHSINTATSRGESVPVYTSRNGYQLPSFQHLDVSFTWHKKKKYVEHEVNVSVYNVYSHFNQFAVYSEIKFNPDGTVSRTYKQVSLFPVLPSITYTIHLL